jgi:1-acyl-sn-glycerol-3-phosphate acyltransferase
VPLERDAGPLLVVCNHTAGVDPLLVQSACSFFVRWMMGKDMRLAWLRDVWDWLDIIDVDRKGRDTRAARVALRALRDRCVVGIFPEGRIERPRGRLLPFQPGLGLIVKSSGAPVLPVFIRGTPDAPTAWGSLSRRSSSVVRFGSLLRFESDDAGAITREIEAWFALQPGVRDVGRELDARSTAVAK